MGSGLTPFEGGDPYGDFNFGEPDDLLKVPQAGFGNCDAIGFPSLAGGKASNHTSDRGLQGKYNILDDVERFQETHKPPPLPHDPFFLAKNTTLRLYLASKFQPSKIGNDLLDFLQKEVVAAVLKVNQLKFAVKANVFVDNRMCTIKAKVYHTGGSEYALEVQRKSGDVIAFSSAFQKAAKYFDERLYFGSTPPAVVAAAMAPAKPPMPPVDMTVLDLEPMLDMADMQGCPSLQAEAVVALLDFVALQLPKTSESLCCNQVFDRINRLLQCDNEEVAYPLAQLLSQLAKTSEAQQYVTEESFTQMVINKACSKESSLLVKNEFSKVASTIAQQHEHALSTKAMGRITAALGKATSPGPSNSKLGPGLETAPMALFGSMGGGMLA
jgi:hypothetical protein